MPGHARYVWDRPSHLLFDLSHFCFRIVSVPIMVVPAKSKLVEVWLQHWPRHNLLRCYQEGHWAIGALSRLIGSDLEREAHPSVMNNPAGHHPAFHHLHPFHGSFQPRLAPQVLPQSSGTQQDWQLDALRHCFRENDSILRKAVTASF